MALFFVYLSVRTIRTRRRLQIAMRVHANFAEYVPLGLLLLALVEARAPAA